MNIDYEKVMNWPMPDVLQSYTQRDTILYALGVACAMTNPPQDPQYVYERALEALPTMAVVLASGPFWMADPGTGIDVEKLLHGEQSLVLHKPLAPSGRVVGSEKVERLVDKGAGRGAVMVLARQLRDADSAELVAEVRMTLMLRGNGGFGGPTEGLPKPHPLPSRAPDALLDLATRPEQAAHYRQASGDLNPLHIDAELARRVGFEKPILHGLCSYGVAGRALVKLLCGGRAAGLRRMDVRFASPVYPGETLRTEVWHEGPGRAAFQVRVLERDLVVMTNGRAEFQA